MGERIRGECGRRMVNAALAEIHDTWTEGKWDIYGLDTDRSGWRRRMRAALEAAFEELLKPQTKDNPHD